MNSVAFIYTYTCDYKKLYYIIHYFYSAFENFLKTKIKRI